jgi:hypothetical protein
MAHSDAHFRGMECNVKTPASLFAGGIIDLRPTPLNVSASRNVSLIHNSSIDATRFVSRGSNLPRAPDAMPRSLDLSLLTDVDAQDGRGGVRSNLVL